MYEVYVCFYKDGLCGKPPPLRKISFGRNGRTMLGTQATSRISIGTKGNKMWR